MCVGRDLFFAALFFCSALLWSDLCRSLPECFALTCLLSLVCLHRLLVCSPAWPLPVALVVKLSNFVCLKQEGAGLVAGEESAGPINCLTLDSHGIFVGVGGVNGLVGVVGRLPCRPRAGVVSLSICVSRSLCVALSLSLFLFLVLPLALSLSLSASLFQSWRSPSPPCRSELRQAGTFSLTVDAGLRQAPLTPAPSGAERVSVSLMHSD